MIKDKKQTKLGSLLEAHVSALIGAPLAVIAHILLLIISGIETDWSNAVLFASASWPVFFYLSVGRQWAIRRLFEKYGINLEPKYIIKKFKKWWNFDI